MKKFIFVTFLLFPLFLILFRDKALADDRCTNWSFKDEKGQDIDTFYKSIDKIDYAFTIKDANKNPAATYNIRLCGLISCSDTNFLDQTNNNKVADANNTITGTITNAKSVDALKNPLYNRFEVIINGGVEPLICRYPIDWKDSLPSQSADCNLTLDPSENITPDKNITLTGKITNLTGISDYSIFKSFGGDTGKNPIIELRGNVTRDFREVNITNSGKEFSADLLSNYPDGTYTATAKLNITSGIISWYIPVKCSITFKVPEGVPTPTPQPTRPAACHGKYAPLAEADGDCSATFIDCIWCDKYRKLTPTKRPDIHIPDLKPLCEQLNPNFQDDCKKCVNPPTGNPPGQGGIWSAIGCLPTDFSALINKYVFTTGVGIAGGIAFLYFLYGAFLILTSSGNAEKMEEAKQIITSALLGLFLIIFSIFLLRTIGVDILGIPGFGPTPTPKPGL